MVVRVPPTISPGLSTSIAEVAAIYDFAFRKRFMSSYESSPSSSPPDLPSRKRYQYDEGPIAEDEDPATGDKGLAMRDENPDMRVKSLSLEGDAAVPEDQQRPAPVMKTAVGEPLRLGYRALRRREIALGEGRMPSVFEVGQSSRSVPDPERPERVLALRPPTLTTWIDLEDDIDYIDIAEERHALLDLAEIVNSIRRGRSPEKMFYPNHEMQKLETELWNHVMVGAGHAAYTDMFHELARLVAYLVTPESRKIERYVCGLAPQIREMVAATEPKTMQKAV
nr:reverse transcriptase domain-containing protein [Tanacetum cinerariifolium]